MPAIACALALSAAVAGCADSVDSDPGAPVGGAGGSAGAGGATVLAAPVLLEVTELSLVLKITWETPALCDSIEGERKTAGEAYAVAFEVPGSDTVYVDEEATKDQPYTYRLRCKRGAKVSDYSNEKTGSPMMP